MSKAAAAQRVQGLALARLPLVATGMASLVIATIAGLARVGFEMPAMHASVHGPLMISGFLGTVIALERAVALGLRWGYAVPALAALAAIVLWLWPDASAIAAQAASQAWSGPRIAGALQFASGVGLSLVCWRLHARQPATHSRVLFAAAMCWPAGTAIWLATGDPGRATVAWIAFLVLTIAAERLELSRFMPARARALTGFFAGAGLCLIAVIASAFAPELGQIALGGGALALAVWLARHDIARRTARLPALAGFIGRSLLAGYFWLAVGGVLVAALASGLAGAQAVWLRDAWLHTLLLGFVMSMVFAHAPVIFPAVMRVRMPWHWSFYLPALLLLASLAVRIAGDVGAHAGTRALGAAGNALALGAFLVVTISAVVRGARAPRS